MKPFFFSLLFSITMITVSFSNPDAPPPPSKDDKIHTLKMLKLTEELKLSEDQTAVLFPLFRNFKDSLRFYEEQRKSDIKNLEELVSASMLDTVQVESVLEDMKNNYLLKEQYFKNLHEKIRDALSLKQYCEYLIFEEKFHRKIRKYIREKGHCDH